MEISVRLARNNFFKPGGYSRDLHRGPNNTVIYPMTTLSRFEIPQATIISTPISTPKATSNALYQHPIIIEPISIRKSSRFPEAAINNSVDFQEMIVREVKIAKALSGETYFPEVIASTKLSYTMKWISGNYSLWDYLDEEENSRGLPVAEALDITDQVAEALDIFSRVKIEGEPEDTRWVFRDLKPENILIVKTKNGKKLVKLIDFGIVCREGERRIFEISERIILGSDGYMAPEALNFNNTLTIKSDLYLLGALLYELLTSRVFCEDLMDNTLQYDNIPELVKDLILAVTKERPRDRTVSDYPEFRDRLSKIV